MRMGTGPQGAIKRELFSDKESLWGYGLIQCRSLIEEMIAGGDFSWQACHEMFARKGLMLQKQHHGLVIVDAFNHELTPVKASSIHPDLTLSRAEPQAGPFEITAADIFERVKPECRYNRNLLPVMKWSPASGAILRLRRERREARAAAREDLRARYLAWKEHWRKPDLRYGERLQEIHAACRRRKAYIRVQFRDHNCVAALPYCGSAAYAGADQAEGSVKEERLSLIAEVSGILCPTGSGWNNRRLRETELQYHSYVAGIIVIVARVIRKKRRTTNVDRCVVLCEPGGTPLFNNVAKLEARLQKNGSVHFRDTRTGKMSVRITEIGLCLPSHGPK